MKKIIIYLRKLGQIFKIEYDVKVCFIKFLNIEKELLNKLKAILYSFYIKSQGSLWKDISIKPVLKKPQPI